DCLVVATPHPNLFESHRLVESDCRCVGRPDFEKGLAHASGRATFNQVNQQSSADSSATVHFANAEVEYVSLTCANAHDAIADDCVVDRYYTADVAHAEAISEDPLAPGKLVRRALDSDDVGDIAFGHRPDQDIRNRIEQLGRGGH